VNRRGVARRACPSCGMRLPLRVLKRSPAWTTPPYGRGPDFLEPDELLGSLAAKRKRRVIYDIEHDCHVRDVDGRMQAAPEEPLGPPRRSSRKCIRCRRSSSWPCFCPLPRATYSLRRSDESRILRLPRPFSRKLNSASRESAALVVPLETVGGVSAPPRVEAGSLRAARWEQTSGSRQSLRGIVECRGEAGAQLRMALAAVDDLSEMTSVLGRPRTHGGAAGEQLQLH
jgi:hypothetical protein